MTEENNDGGLEQMVDEAVSDLQSIDPEHLAAVSIVVATTEQQSFDGDESDGDSWGFARRAITDDTSRFEDPNDVVATVVAFNGSLEDAKIPVERPENPLSGLF